MESPGRVSMQVAQEMRLHSRGPIRFFAGCTGYCCWSLGSETWNEPGLFVPRKPPVGFSWGHSISHSLPIARARRRIHQAKLKFLRPFHLPGFNFEVGPLHSLLEFLRNPRKTNMSHQGMNRCCGFPKKGNPRVIPGFSADNQEE